MAFKILSPLNLAITGSTPGTPAAGFGNLYASGSSIYYKNPAGVEYNLAQGSSSLAIYPTPGTSTWTKKPNLSEILVIAIGAGGGGGSGRRGTTNSSKGGGSGGGGGALVYRRIKASDLAASYTVTVGAGGNGGAAQGTNTANGNAGTAGGDTSFGTLVVAKGGGGGPGGSTAAVAGGAGGSNIACTPSNMPYAFTGTNGAAGAFGAAATAPSDGFGLFACSGGGGGGGANNTTLYAASGTRIYSGLTLITTAAPANTAGLSGNAGANNQNLFLLQTSTPTSNPLTVGAGGGGSGGSAGNSGATIAGGVGGAGGNAGAGGGGGGASSNGINSGAGGNGGNGLLIIYEFY